MDPRGVIGRPPERLTLQESAELVGKWIALEVYTPESLPLRKIEAIGGSVEECIRQLGERSLDPRKFEFLTLKPPY